MLLQSELFARSYYSFLQGSSAPEDLAIRASELGYKSIALVDRNGLYGAIDFVRQCEKLGIQPILGAQLSLEGGKEISVLCENMEGYRELSHAISSAYDGREKGDPLLHREALSRLAQSRSCFCLLGSREQDLTSELACEMKTLFGPDRCYVLLFHHLREGDEARCRRWADLAKKEGLALLASHAPQYAQKEQGMLCDVLRCIHEGVKLSDSTSVRAANFEAYLKGKDELPRIFTDFPEAISNSNALAERCQIQLDFSRYRFPDYELEPGRCPEQSLRDLCWRALPKKYPQTIQAAGKQLEQELELIERLQMSGYFLLVWDLVQFAKREMIPVQGRGSAANSLVAYLLGITPVDPIANKLFLGRFIHDGMRSSPDIDLDFASTRSTRYRDREDVIRYVYERYGKDHVAMVCTFVTFQMRSAIREVGKVLDMPKRLLDRMAKMAGHYGGARSLDEICSTPEIQADLQSPLGRTFCRLVSEILNLPRHPSIHVGGMLIASCPIADIVPLEPARMEGRVVCQWDKDMVEDAGLIKNSRSLGLGMLAVLRECAEMIDCPHFWDLPSDDPEVYRMISQADTVGVFQVESRAQMQSLPRTKPQTFTELGVQVAIIRPGPLQGNMVSPYIKRKQGKEKVEYLHPKLEPVLKDTLGVILYQEQVLQTAVVLANFSHSQAEELRRAMSRKRSSQAMALIKEQFVTGCLENEVSRELAERVFASLEGFALYGFCKSHALSFARISYLSGWLKRYHPAAFTAALLNNQPMGFYPSKTVLDDAKRHGVNVLPIDVNASETHCSLENGSLRLGLCLVNGMAEDQAETICKTRCQQQSFLSVRHFLEACDPPVRLTEKLIQAGAFDCFGLSRRELLWQLWLLKEMDLSLPELLDLPLEAPNLPKAGAWELLLDEYKASGLSAKTHPLALLRDGLKAKQVSTSLALARSTKRERLQIAGLVVCRQRPPTAKGFAFLTLEDEFGMINTVIPPDLYDRRRYLIRQNPLMIIDGFREHVEGVYNLKAIDLIEL